MKSLIVYMVLSFLPWIIFVAVISSTPDFNVPFLIAIPVVLQLLNVGGFLWWMRVKRKAFRTALSEKCAAINTHFAGRGVNFVAKKSERNLGDKIIIEVAARNNAMPTPAAAFVPQPVIYAQQPQQQQQYPQQYAVVDTLPQGAVPMAAYPAAYPSPYGEASFVDHEKAGLLRK